MRPSIGFDDCETVDENETPKQADTAAAAPRSAAVCASCSRLLERGYLHDLSSSKRYCGTECYPRRMMVSGFVGSAVAMDPFALAIAWSTLTVDAASALFDGAWGDDGA